MLDKEKAISVLNREAQKIEKINTNNFKNGIDKKLKYGESKCARYVKRAIAGGGVTLKNANIESAKNYGPSLLSSGFKTVDNVTTVKTGDVFSISDQQAGDIVIIQAAPNHVHGHMAMFNGNKWVSDFVQDKGFYPAKIYRDNNVAYTLYRYINNVVTHDNYHLIKINWPIPSNNKGSEFGSQEAILSHLRGEATGLYMIGRNGMWHGGIHITS